MFDWTGEKCIVVKFVEEFVHAVIAKFREIMIGVHLFVNLMQ